MSNVSTPRRRLWLLPAILIVLLLIYTLGGFYGLPRLMVWLAQSEVAKINRQLDIAELRFNPFSFELHLRGLSLREADGAPLLAFESLYVNAEPARSIQERSLVLQALHWTRPDLSVVVEADGSVNLSKLVPPSAEPAPPDDPAASLPHLRITDLRLSSGRIGLEDRSRTQPFKLALTPIEFTLADFRTALNHRNDYAFTGKTDTGEELEWSGAFTVQPIASTGRFALRNLKASTIASYLQDQLPMQLASGVAETSGEYDLSLQPTLTLNVKLPLTTLRDWAVNERDAKSKTAPLSVRQIGVHDVALSLHQQQVSVARIEVEGVRADVVRASDGGLNLSRVFAPQGKTPETSRERAEGEPESSWHVTLAQLRVQDAEIDVQDRSLKPTLRLAFKPIRLEVSNISTDFSRPMQLAADLGIAGSARLKASGPLQLEPLSTQLKLDLKNVDLALVRPYLAQHTGLELKSGQLAVQGDLAFAQPEAGASKLSFDGAAQLANLDVQDRALKQDLLKWRALNVEGIAFRQAPDRLDIAKLELREPYARLLITSDRELNLTRALASPTSATPAKAQSAAVPNEKADGAALPILIKTIEVERGQLAFSDQSIEPQFSASIFDLGGRIEALSTRVGARARIDLKGKVDEFAPVLIQGQMSPLAAESYTDVALSFRNMDLIRFNPYSGRFAGYNIVKGKLSTELKYTIKDRALQAEHHVVIDQLEFGEATGSKDAVPLPVKLAVALLKDRHGVIDLGLPVSGSLDDPSFRIGPLVWKVLVNLMTKAVSAPFAALGSLFGGGEELAWVEFAPGSAALSEAESAKLDTLAQALVERPQLRLDIPLARVDEADAVAMTETALDQTLAGDSERPVAVAAAATSLSRLQALELRSRQMSVSLPEPVALTSPEVIELRIATLEQNLKTALRPELIALEDLAEARAQAVQARLLANTQVEPERVFFSARAGGELSGEGMVRMKLQLE